MKIKKYKEFITETNLMNAVGKGSQINFVKLDFDAFIDQDEALKKVVVPGKDREGKTLFNTTSTKPEAPTQITNY